MTKKLQKYFSMIKEIQRQQDEFSALIKKDKPIGKLTKEQEKEFIITIIKEFPNSSTTQIMEIAHMLMPNKTPEYFRRLIWSCVDNGFIGFDESWFLSIKKEIKKTRKPKIQPPYLGDPVWESPNEMSVSLLNIVDLMKK